MTGLFSYYVINVAMVYSFLHGNTLIYNDTRRIIRQAIIFCSMTY
jgi:hypothetical protein